MVIKMDAKSPELLLKTVFGYDQFHPLQREAITATLQKKDSLVIMPTGGGKSLCYQIPALMFPGLTVVVSPLIALMKDQVEQMVELGIPALFINSTLSWEQYQKNMNQVRSGKTKLLYVAPETLLTPRILDLLSAVDVDCLTIDEAHCISEWGHDFRPEYRQLVEVRKRFPKAVCLAMTATATHRVREDIKSTLKLKNPSELIASFDRPNLMIEVVEKNDPQTQVLKFLRQYKDQSGIIYCFSRKQVDDLSVTLSRHGFLVKPYHAGLEDEERRKNQELFIRDDVQIIVATIAFGMGINKPNVRFVIHYDLPKSIENYYQEIGRAGRDGLPAHCLMLYSYGDIQKQKYFIEQKPLSEQKWARQHLDNLVEYAESAACRRIPLLAHFGEKYTRTRCGMCDNCNRPSMSDTHTSDNIKKFLNCILQTGEMFGAVHLADVLLGVKTEKVIRFNHQKLPIFGKGKELNQNQWVGLSRQLLKQDLILQDERYKGLKLTNKGTGLLKTKVIEPEKNRVPPIIEEIFTSAPAAEKMEYNRALFYILRQKRKDLADQAGIPPYAIFPDKTLIEMATYYPMTEQSLKTINGVGIVKIKHYGNEFLQSIRDYCVQRQIEEKPKPQERD